MTAAYMTRCIYLTFFGEYRGGHAARATRPASGARARSTASTRRSRSTHDAHARRSAREQLAHHHAALGAVVVRDLRRLPQLPALRRSSRSGSSPRDPLASPRRCGTPRSTRSSPRSRCAIALIGVGLAWAFYTGRLEALQRLSSAATRRRASARRSSSTSTTSTGCTGRHRRRHQGPDRARRVLVQPARHRQRSQLHREGRPCARAASRTTTSTRRASTAWSTASRRSPAKPVAQSARSRPVGCSSTH